MKMPFVFFVCLICTVVFLNQAAVFVCLLCVCEISSFLKVSGAGKGGGLGPRSYSSTEMVLQFNRKGLTVYQKWFFYSVLRRGVY